MRAWRKLHSGIVTSDKLAGVSYPARWLFTLLVVAQDDDGRYPVSATKTKALTVGTDWAPQDVSVLWEELATGGLILVTEYYVEVVGGADKNGTPSNSSHAVVTYDYPAEQPLTMGSDTSMTQVSYQYDKRVEESREEKSREEKNGVAAVAFLSILEEIPGIKVLPAEKKLYLRALAQDAYVAARIVPALEAREFVSYWTDGKGVQQDEKAKKGAKVYWDRRWANWLRIAVKPQKEVRNGSGSAKHENIDGQNSGGLRAAAARIGQAPD